MEIKSTFDKSSYQLESIKFFKQALESLRKTKQEISVALPGGRSIVPLLESMAQADQINFRGIHFYSLDERIVPVVDHLSNNYFLHEIFFNKMIAQGRILKDQVHLFHPRGKLKDYATLLEKFDNRFDIVILGVGEDGHIGALFPNHESLEMSEQVYGDFQSSPKFPPMRMSATINMVKKSQYCLTLFWGPEKQEAFNKFSQADTDISQLPVNVVKTMSNVQVVTCFEKEDKNG